MSRSEFEELIDGLSAVIMTVDFGSPPSLERALGQTERIDTFLEIRKREAFRNAELSDAIKLLRRAVESKPLNHQQAQSLRLKLAKLTEGWYDTITEWNASEVEAANKTHRALSLSEVADPTLLGEFISNTKLTGEDLESHIHALRAGDVESLGAIRRILHSLKGEAGMLGINELAQLLHAAESYLEVPSPAWEQADLLFRIRDWLIDALRCYERGLNAESPADELVHTLCQAIERAERLTSPIESGFPEVPRERHPSPSTPKDDVAKPQVVPIDDRPAPAPLVTEPPPSSSPTIWDEQELELVAEFLTESHENLVSVDQILLEIERDGPDGERINKLFRAFHTLKGVASFLRLKQIVELSHNTETMLASVRSGTLPAEAGVIDLVFDATNLLRTLLVAVKTAIGTSSPLRRVVGVTELVGRIKATTQGSVPRAVALEAQPGNKLGEILVENGAISETQLLDALTHQKQSGRMLGAQLIAEGTVPAKVVAQALRGQSGAVTQTAKTREVLKVDLERIDSLVEAIGELVIVESMVSNAPEIRALPPHLRNHLGQFAKITRELQELGMCMRMVPLRAEFQKMARMVRDLTHRINKRVRVELRGENTEMDRSMVEQIADPLVHLIRNAVDHGIEPPDERSEAGKPETGTLVLSASHEGSSIVIEISDDGRGINRERVLQKAVSQGLIQDGAVLTDSQVFDLLFMPGFSTAAQVTEISGRGVGMDVVKRNIEAVRGRVTTTSIVGRGTTFRLVLPLTLAIIDGMVIRCGTERFILPTLNTLESLQPSEDMLFRVVGRHERVLVRGRSLPLIRLGHLLEVSDCEPDPTKALIVIVESIHAQVAFLVDEVIMKHQVVIKTLGSELDSGQLFAGAAILSNGRVGLILNVDSLVEASLSLHQQPIHAVA